MDASKHRRPASSAKQKAADDQRQTIEEGTAQADAANGEDPDNALDARDSKQSSRPAPAPDRAEPPT